jgi:hypothetical protein
MTQTIQEKNKAFVLKAFETLFNKRDYAAADHFWSPNYLQHSAHIPPGREGLFALIKGAPDSLHYENGLTVADGDTCSSTAGSRAWACRRRLWWISYASRTANLPSTGTSSRTRRRRKRPLAACPCLGRHFPRDDLARCSSRRFCTRANVRLGWQSKADVTLLNFDVRFTPPPKSGHSPTRGLEVDDEIEFRQLHNGRSTAFSPLRMQSNYLATIVAVLSAVDPRVLCRTRHHSHFCTTTSSSTIVLSRARREGRPPLRPD